MTWLIILQILLLGVALSMDAFAVAVTDGLTYKNIDKKKSFFIAATFGLFQALMPLIGYFIVEFISVIVGEDSSTNAGKLMSIIVTWLAFSLLLLIGVKMIIEGVREYKKPIDEKKEKKFSIKEVLYFGVATSIDALGTGVALHAGLSDNYTIWLHVSIIMIITFIISLIGLFLGKQIVRLLKGKFEYTTIIGGCILLALAIWIVISNYVGL